MTNRNETIEVRGVRYHVELSGAGDPLVFLHGFTGSAANWTPIRRQFEPRFTTIAIDLPGHGQTDSPTDLQRFSIEQAANDLTILLNQLHPATSVHLLGYSMGGRLALYTALSYPHLVRSLILESASPGLKTEAERAARRQHDEQLAAQIESEGLEPFVNDWTNQPLFATQSRDLRETLREQRLQNNPQGLVSSLRSMGTGAQPSLWQRLGELTCPTQLIVGALDDKFVAIAREMSAQISGASLAIVPGAGHTVHAERAEAYAQTVLDFLLTYT